MLGLIEADRKKYEQAREWHAKALSIDPYNATAHYNMGVALDRLKRFDEARGAYEAALMIEPGDAEAENNLGLLFGRAGMYEDAVLHHLRALDINPHFPEAAFNLGLAYRAKGMLMQAAEALTLALQLNPELTQAKKLLEEMGIENARLEVEDVTDDVTSGNAGAEIETVIESADTPDGDTESNGATTDTAVQDTSSPGDSAN